MIKKTPSGYKVTSESGKKNLSKPNLTKAQAEKRLKQVEYFKNKGKWWISVLCTNLLQKLPGAASLQR